MGKWNIQRGERGRRRGQKLKDVYYQGEGTPHLIRAILVRIKLKDVQTKGNGLTRSKEGLVN